MNYEEKRMYGEFVRDMLVETDKNKTWNFQEVRLKTSQSYTCCIPANEEIQLCQSSHKWSVEPQLYRLEIV